MVATTEAIYSNNNDRDRLIGVHIGKSLFAWAGDSETNRMLSDKLNEQIRRSLLTAFSALPMQSDTEPERKALFDRGMAMLSASPISWQDIYEAQQIRAHLIPNEEVTVALRREADHAQALGLDVSRIVNRFDAGDTTGPLQAIEGRALLVNLVADVTLERHKRYLRRHLRSRYMKKVCTWTLAVGSLFFIALAWGVMANRKDHGVYDFANNYLRYPGLLIAIASGILGAWFSMLVSAEKRLSGLSLEELRSAQSNYTLLARMIFGASAAVIFYFLLRAGIVKADILPDISAVGFEPMLATDNQADRLREMMQSSIKTSYQGNVEGSGSGIVTSFGRFLPSQNMCLLIVWGVICGFSEKLIPATLTRNADAATMGSAEAK